MLSAKKVMVLALAAAAGAALAQPAHAAAPPLFDIPRLEGITVDGKADDWGDHGFRVDLLTDAAAAPRPPQEFDAAMRLGWDKRGLLVLLNVRDSTPQQEANDNALWQRDSVEIFFASKRGGPDQVQVVIAPGVDPAHPELRFRVLDQRKTAALKSALPEATVARTRVEGGYILETLLPWGDLGISPARGTEVGFQILINDLGGPDGRRTALWYPLPGANNDTNKTHRLRLSDRPGKAVCVAASGWYERFRRTGVRALAPEALAGQRVEVRAGRRLLAAGKLERSAGRAEAVLALPMPPIGKPYPPLQVRVSGQPPVEVPLPDADAMRRDAFRRAAMVFRPFVFSGEQFPACDFEQPSLVEDLIGPYTIRTSFYDAQYQPVTLAKKPGRYGAIVAVRGADGNEVTRRFTLYRQEKPLEWRRRVLPFTVELPEELGISPEVAREQPGALSEYLTGLMADGLSRDAGSGALLAGLAEAKAGTPARVAARDGRYWYGLRKKLGDLKPLRYLLVLPEGYEADTTKSWPLVLFLHGSGERGDNLEAVKTHGPPKLAAAGRKFPFILVAPQCPNGEWWSPWALRDMLEEIRGKCRVDTDRMYLTGLSMGGFGTWEMAMEFPGMFAAIAPICGGGDPGAVSLIKHLPTWVFHGGKDPVVPVRLGREMVDALHAAGNPAKLTIYPEAGHDSWTEAYNTQEFYDWLLAQKRGQQ